MKSRWQLGVRLPHIRREVEFWNRVRGLRMRHQVDFVSVSGLIAVLVVLAGLFTSVVLIGRTAGWFDSSLMAHLADERLLTNVRDELPDKVLLDAVYHTPARQVILAQQGGAVHRYDPATRLWSTEWPFRNRFEIQSDLVQLRSGCGADPLSSRADVCADPDSLWARSEAGGLVRRTGGRWDVLIGDSRLVGARGRPVEHADLTAAAISSDGEWLAVGTRLDGIGLYDNRRHTWLALGADFYAALPGVQVDHLIWTEGRFWVGGPQGLSTVTAGGEPRVARIAAVDGAVLDMDPDIDGGVWILQRHQCANALTDCLWLGRLDARGRPQSVLLAEEMRYPDLTLGDLSFAQFWPAERFLLVAGTAGVYSYNLVSHNWEQVHDVQVSSARAQPDGRAFYYGYLGGIGRVSPGKTQLWTLPDNAAVVRKLMLSDAGRLLAFGTQGELYALDSTLPLTPTLVYDPQATAIEPTTFGAAATIANTVFMVGEQGVLLHDPITRRYTDIPADDVPKWLSVEGTRLITADDTLFVLEGGAVQRQSIYSVPADVAVDPLSYQQQIHELESRSVPAPVKAVWAWGHRGLGMVASDGRAYRIEQGEAYYQSGSASSEMDALSITDVAALNNGLVFATPQGLRGYDGEARAWEEGYPLLEDDTPVELAVSNGVVHVRTEGGQLLVLGEDALEPRIGETGFSLGDDDITDVRWPDAGLYLAGAGRVERYDPDARSVDKRWKLAGSGRVELADIFDGEPLSQVAENVFLGEDVLDPGAGVVLSVATDGDSIWTVREADGVRYLKGYRRTNLSDVVCYFRQPSLPGAARVIDAREIPGNSGRLAVATDVGLAVYDTLARTWRSPGGEMPAIEGRLYALGAHLLFAQPVQEGAWLWLIGPGGIHLPTSCDVGAAHVTARVIETVGYAVDEEAKRLAWVTADGEVREWTEDNERLLLSAPGTAPARHEWRRVFRSGGDLLFTTDTGIWRYSLSLRSWKEVEVRFAGGAAPIADMSIESTAGGDMVAVRTDAGELHYGRLDSSAVTLKRVYAHPLSTFAESGANLVSAYGANDSLWTFLLADRIQYYDPVARTWGGSIPLDGEDRSRWLGRVGDRRVLVGQAGKRWEVAVEDGASPAAYVSYDLRADERTALDYDGVIWRLLPDASVLKCAIPYDTCETYVTAPATFEVASLQSVTKWIDVYLLSNPAGLSVISKSGAAVSLPPEIRDMTEPLHLREMAPGLWIHHPGTATLALFRRGGNESAGVRTWADVRHLAFDQRGTAWVETTDGWFVWLNDNLVRPAFDGSAELPEEVLLVSVIDGGIPTAIGAEGALYAWDGQKFEHRRILPDVDPAAIRWMTAADGETWWISLGDQLVYLNPGREVCGPTPTPGGEPTTTITTTVPVPTATPCPDLVAVAQVSVSEVPAHISIDGGALHFWGKSGQGRRAEFSAAGILTVTDIADPLPTPVGAATDARQELLDSSRQLPSGPWAVDPVTDLSVAADGRLSAVRPFGRMSLATTASLLPSAELALDVGWLRWSGTRFEVAAADGGKLGIAAADFVVGGQLLFESANALLPLSAETLVAANRFGLWTYSSGDMSLVDPGVRFQPLALGDDITAAHGRFFVGSEQIVPSSGLRSAAPASNEVSVDGATWRESLRDRRVEVTLLVDNLATDMAVSNGFLWDVQRRGLGYADQTLLLQSDAGIGPVAGYSGFGRAPDTSGQLVCCERGLGPLVRGASGWYQLRGGAWMKLADDPTASRQMVQNSSSEWVLHGGTAQVTLQGQAYSFLANVGPEGFGFSSDRLRAAAVGGGRLFVLTDAFLEVAASPDELGDRTAARYPPVVAEVLQVLPERGGAGLYRRAGSSVTRWDDGQGAFMPVSDTDNPYMQRVLAEGRRLRFTLRRDVVVKEIAVDDVSGQASWVEYDFDNGRLPIDMVTAVSERDGILYVGSAAGLQAYATGGTELGSMAGLLDMRPGGQTELALVERIGTPLADPARLMARGPATCFELSGKGFQACSDPELLDTRLRIHTDLWRWHIGSDGVTGLYLDTAGLPSRKRVSAADGRLPHDRLIDVAYCGTQLASLWDDGWITIYADDTLRLLPGLRNYPPAESVPQRLICLGQDLELPGGTLAGGLFYEAADGHMEQMVAGAWIPVHGEDAVEALKLRSERPPAFERPNLRLLARQDDAPLVFEWRTQAGAWRPLSWLESSDKQWQIAVDHWHELLAVGTDLWASTTGGLALFTLGSDRVVLDPDTFVLIDTPCEGVTDLEQIAGETWLRCASDSAQSHHGLLDHQTDTGVFAPGGDPFIERTLVGGGDEDPWKIRRVGNVSGSAGHLTIEYRAEPVVLTGGRLTVDAVNSIAAFEQGTLEWGTSAAGWYRSPVSQADLFALMRPDTDAAAAADVIKLGIAMQDAQHTLCLRQSDGTARVMQPGGGYSAVGACLEVQGSDDIWQYDRAETGLVITAPTRSEGGTAVRELREGRFLDDVVIGVPTPVRDGDSWQYLLPTAGGVYEVDRQFTRRLLHALPFDGLAADQTPSAVYALPEGGAAYVGREALHRLDAVQASLAAPMPSIPAGALLRSIEDGPYDTLRLVWELDGRRGQTLVERREAGAALSEVWQIDVSAFPKFAERRAQWGDQPPWLQIAFNHGGLEFRIRDSLEPVRLTLGPGFELLAPVLYEDRLILLGRADLLDISLETALVQLLDTNSSHDPE